MNTPVKVIYDMYVLSRGLVKQIVFVLNIT